MPPLPAAGSTTSGTSAARTGKPVAFRGITWLRFANGRLAEGWDSWNQGRLMQELQAAANGAT